MARRKVAGGAVVTDGRGRKGESFRRIAAPTSAPAKWWTSEDPEIAAKRARLAANAPLIFGRLKLDTERMWSEVLQPWQIDAFASALGLPTAPDPGNPLVWVDGPTGSGKDQLIAAVILALLHCGPKGLRVNCYSTDLERNTDVIDTIKGFCLRERSAGNCGEHPIVFVRNEVRLESADIRVKLETCDGASASGARSDLFIFNEVQAWRDPHGKRVYTEVLARFGKKGGRVVVFSNAPWTGEGDWRRDAWESARKPRAKGGLWTYFGIRAKDCPWITPQYLAMQRQLLPDVVYRRLFECVPSDGRQELVTKEIVDRAVYPELAQLGDPAEKPWGLPGLFFAGCDLGVTRDHAVIVVLRRTPQGAVFLCRVEVWVPDPHSADPKKREVQIAEVEARLRVYVKELRARVMLDPYQAIQMKQRLEAEGAQVEQVAATAANLTEMASAVISCFRDGVVRVYPDAGRTEVHDGRITSLAQQLLDAEVKEQEKGVRVVVKRTSLGHGDQLSAFMLALLGAMRAEHAAEVAASGSGAGAPAGNGRVIELERARRFLGARAGTRRESWRSGMQSGSGSPRPRRPSVV